MSRNYELLSHLSGASDDILVGVDEVAALTGLARLTIQQRRIKDFPAPIPAIRRLKWRLGTIRKWIQEQQAQVMA